MVSKTVIVLLSLASASVAWPWGKSGKWDHKQRTTCHGGDTFINYTSVAGFFQQDDPATDASTFDYTKSNYGLINRSYTTDGEVGRNGEKTLWQRFEHYVNRLNQDADKNTQYKVLLMGRHGEGFHNAAESYFGTPAWNCYWGPLDGNGTVVWRDAHLTSAGMKQTDKAFSFWTKQLAEGKQPAPQSYYTSPLTRCTTTANFTFNGLDLPKTYPFVPIVKEFLREGISMRTCDERSNRTYIQSLFPWFRFEKGFTEKDELWKGYEGETSSAQLKRAREVLDDIVSNDDNTWISITSHSGHIRTILQVLNHRSFSLSTGQAIAVLVKAENFRKVETPTSTVQSWTAEATCKAPPVTSIGGTGCVCSTASSTLATASSSTLAAASAIATSF